MKISLKECWLRFFLGGLAVAACYIISVYSPVRLLGGVFAAFPAVMASAVSMAGVREGDRAAAEVARGAVAGMVGCAACVLAALHFITALSSWPLGLAVAVAVWFITALLINTVWPARHRGGR